VTSAIGYGQIDLLIAVLVLTDLTRGRDARWGGLLVGAAAALKLTPLIFIPYLALSERPRMAARAAGVFALSIATAFLLAPSDASGYWAHGVFDTSHVTGGGHANGRGPANQSLHGALLRLAPQLSHQPAVWMAVCALVAAAGLLAAVSAARRGDEASGFVVAAVTGLLVCPVTWVHHWVIAVPGLLLLASAPAVAARRRLRVLLALAVAAGSWAIKPAIAAHPTGELGIFGSSLDDLYVIAGLAILATAVVEAVARRRRPRPLAQHRLTSENDRPRRDAPSKERIRCPEPA
jgi:alpha-1,2-mannosyltransferase